VKKIFKESYYCPVRYSIIGWFSQIICINDIKE
jgi:hypothetical protein